MNEYEEEKFEILLNSCIKYLYIYDIFISLSFDTKILKLILMKYLYFIIWIIEPDLSILQYQIIIKQINFNY